MFLLLKPVILGLFVDTLTANYESSHCNSGNLQFTATYSNANIRETKKLLRIFLLHFSNLYQILNDFKK